MFVLRSPLRWPALIAVLVSCSDALEQNTTSGQTVAVLNRTSVTLTFLDARDYSATTVALGGTGSTPAALGVRGAAVVVPLGAADAVQIASPLGAGALIALASGADPAGAAVENDSVAWITERGLDQVVRVHFDSGPAGGLATGSAPGAALFVGEGLLYVLNTNTGAGPPYPPGSISWFALADPPAEGTIALTGSNPRSAILGGDGYVYVVTAGDPGQANGRLSIIDPTTHREVAVLNGLGESPGQLVYHPSGRVLIASATEGILEVDAATRRVVRGPGAGMKPEGDGISAIAVDSRGRLYAAAARGCAAPGVVHVLTAPPVYQLLETVDVGVCPNAAALVAPPGTP